MGTRAIFVINIPLVASMQTVYAVFIKNRGGLLMRQVKGFLVRLATTASSVLILAGVLNFSDSMMVSATSQYPELVSVSANGEPADGYSTAAQISKDGRYVAYLSYANNLGGQRPNAATVYVYDRVAHTTTLASVTGDGQQENGYLLAFAFSGDGRHVAFVTNAANLDPNLPNTFNGSFSTYLRDLDTGTTSVVSVDSHGQRIYGGQFISISNDGTRIAFSGYPNTNKMYVRDTATNSTQELAAPGEVPIISSDGTKIAYIIPFGLYPGAGSQQIGEYDLATDTITLVSTGTDGIPGNGQSANPSISDNGRYVVFNSNASNLLPGDSSSCSTGQCPRVYRRDITNGITERVDVTSTGSDLQAVGGFFNPTISADGSVVAFTYSSPVHIIMQVGIHDFKTGDTRIVSNNSIGQTANAQTNWSTPSLNGDGTLVAFSTAASNFGLTYIPCDPNDPTEGNCTPPRVFVTTTAGIAQNTAPTVGAIAAPADPVSLNTSISAAASFTDSDSADTHTAVWNWGDGSTSLGTVTEANGSGSVSGAHSYGQAGVYTVQLMVTDNGGLSAAANYQYIVVYNPSTTASFVASGVYSSQAGWDVQDPAANGNVIFGISARYTNGTLSAQAKMKFKQANLEFKSTSCQWLVVNGATGQLKCTGTINGSGTYTMLVTGIDGSKSGGSDALRIKITDTPGTAIYDTQPGASDTATPTAPISGGSITVHS